jgi:signal peptidase I
MKTFNTIYKFISVSFFILLFCYCVIIYKSKSVCGYRFAVVSGNSMYPTIYDGDFLIVKQNFEKKCGDVVCFVSDNKQIVHRIVEIKNDSVITKGDNNKYEDAAVKECQIIGKVVYKSTLWGFIYKHIRSIVLLAAIFVFFKLKKNNKYDKINL